MTQSKPPVQATILSHHQHVPPVQATILPDHQGILTPNLCQICRKPGPGIVTVRGINGRLFSAHRWPCAEREGLQIDSRCADPWR